MTSRNLAILKTKGQQKITWNMSRENKRKNNNKTFSKFISKILEIEKFKHKIH